MDSIAALLRNGQTAAQAGQRAKARRKFRAALVFDPVNVTALLWLAWLSDDPRASLAYIARALTSDPKNLRAHAALRWARRRMNSHVLEESPHQPTSATPTSHTWKIRSQVWERPFVKSGFLVILALLIILVGVALARPLPNDLPVLAALALTPSPTAMATASPTLTPTQTPTPTSTPTPTPTLTPTQFPTATPRPVLPTAPPLPPPATLAPLSIHSNVRWIDVDLTHQRLTAYEGQTMVRTTLISTGLPRTPTPTGQYHIGIKLRYDDMSGPGYYLPDVPYTMYFYGGYGLHGTYWHNNFGHPMSHGCVNLPTPEAEWLFNWAKVGTLVNIH